MLPMKIDQFSRPPTPPLSIYIQNSSNPLALDVQFQTIPPSSPKDNQSIKKIYNPSMTIMLSGSSCRSAFVFSINSLILSDFPLTSFHLTKASLSAFSWLYILVCAVVQKYHKMFYLKLFIVLVLILQSSCLAVCKT